ncbi:MAG TPA: hypothetical protein VLH37_07945 [Bacteroidales bacterium]|nr:hypothetical protein [Bacteroidales bacterium]
MKESALSVIVQSGQSKFGRYGFRRICGLESVEKLMTDSLVAEYQDKEFEEKGVQVIRV